jgi:hypothetical protein
MQRKGLGNSRITGKPEVTKKGDEIGGSHSSPCLLSAAGIRADSLDWSQRTRSRDLATKRRVSRLAYLALIVHVSMLIACAPEVARVFPIATCSNLPHNVRSRRPLRGPASSSYWGGLGGRKFTQGAIRVRQFLRAGRSYRRQVLRAEIGDLGLDFFAAAGVVHGLVAHNRGREAITFSSRPPHRSASCRSRMA